MNSSSLTSTEQVRAQAVRLAAAPLDEVLHWAYDAFGEKAAIGTSFQGAGLVMIHHALQAGIVLPVFTLDTGVLFPETLALKDRLETFWGIEIESVKPTLSLEAQEAEFGAELWRSRPDFCCQLRKVEPLRERLESLSVWITGVRQEQGETRKGAAILERYVFDPLMERTILKLNPMVAWTREQVWAYIKTHGIPYNPLHDKGYRSIGCQPCTRVSNADGAERAGRWEGFEKTECGIHTFLPVAQ
ncbi:MAG: phosphoadenylyl-sulfate reductase [Verrucomicrobiota bacterium]